MQLYVVMNAWHFSLELHQVPMLSEVRVLHQQIFASFMSEETSLLRWNMTQKAIRLHGR